MQKTILPPAGQPALPPATPDTLQDSTPADQAPPASGPLAAASPLDAPAVPAASLDRAETYIGSTSEIASVPGFPSVHANYAVSTPIAQNIEVALGEDIPILTSEIMMPLTSGRDKPKVAGRIYIVGDESNQVNLKDIPAAATVVPQARGASQVYLGIAESWHAKADDVGGEAGDEIKNALGQYAEAQADEFGQEFQSGKVVRAVTHTDDPAVPKVFIHVASVPDESLRKTSGATAEDRMRHTQNVAERIVHEVRRLRATGIIKDGDAISLPLIGAGSEGNVSHGECAAVLFRVLGEYMQSEPGINFIIPLYGRYSSSDTFPRSVEEVRRIFSGDKEQLENLSLPTTDSAHVMLERLLHTYMEPVRKGVRVDEGYLTRKYAEWMTKFTQRIASLPDAVINSRCIGRDKFGSTAERECFNQIHKMAQAPDLEDHDSLIKPKTVSKADLLRLIVDPEIRQAALMRISNKLKLMRVNKNFGGDAAMIQIIAGAVASVIEERRRKLLENIENGLQTRVEGLQQKITAQEKQLGLLPGEIEMLRKKLHSSTDELEQARTQVRTAVAQRLGLDQANTDLKRHISDLESELRQVSSQLSAQRSYSSTYTSQSAPTSTMRSLHDTGESRRNRGYSGE